MGFEKKQTNFFRPMTTTDFFKGHQKHRSFSWPYVEPPSKSDSNSKSDDDAIEFETSEIVQKMTTGHLVSQKYQKQNNWLFYNPSIDGYTLSYTHK